MKYSVESILGLIVSWKYVLDPVESIVNSMKSLFHFMNYIVESM